MATTAAAAEEVEAGAGSPIAAFAVAKGGVVLKHIFLNGPPTEAARRGADADRAEDPPVLFGRHPDCHVLIDHPSVSRRHLEVRCKRRQRRITVTDLSSVHGTWISGQRIPPNTLVELVAGDTLQLGASKREYRLHWLSLREAFEMDDLLPPLVEEDKEEIHTHQEAQDQLVPGQREPMDTRTHQETKHQVVSEQTECWAKVISSAPPLPESSLSHFHDNRAGAIGRTIVSENSITESVGSSIIQAAGKPVQSDKQKASDTMSRRAKLKSVKSLHIDTGRRSRTLSYSYKNEEAQNENRVCSQNCKGECAACMVLFDNFDVKAGEKERMVAPEKVHMNPHVMDSSTMERNQEVPNPLNLERSDEEKSILNFAKETEQHDIISENSIPQDSFDAKPQMGPESPCAVSPSVSKYGTFANQISQLDSTIHMESYEAMPENHFTHDMIDGNTNSHQEMKHDGLSHHKLDGVLSNKEKMAQNKIVVEDCQLEGIIFGSIFDNLDIEATEEKEEISLLDKENTTPYASSNITFERSQIMLKPTSSQELMDSISPLNLEHFSEGENSVLNIVKKMKSNELTSENLIPLMSVKREFMLMPDEDFKNDIIPDKENSVPPGKYNAAISPAEQGNLFLDENVAPASMDLKPIAGKVLGSRMDSSVSAEFTSNRSIHQRECSELSSEYDATSPVRQQNIFPDKENVTPPSRVLKSIGRKVLGSRMDNSVSAGYTPNRSISKRECNDLSSKSKRFHTVDAEAFYSDKENLTPISTGGMKARSCLPKNLFPVDADQDQEAFCSDKENSTPISTGGMKARSCLPKNLFPVDADQDQEAFCSDKENSTPVSCVALKTRDVSENRARIESAITKKRVVVDRLPFQTLLSNSPLRPTSSFDCTQADASEANLSIRLEDELNSLPHKNHESNRVGEGMKVWTMLADTDCLLDDESRKSIMLLKGIKGTHLIIPRIVMRELECMKQREGMFKRSSKATSIMQWIEDSVENESWWIHVQSSSEMLPVAPTPPATPTETQRNSEESEATAAGAFNSMLALFSPRSFTGIFSPRSLTDIDSPKTEDRVLDCALLFNKLRGSGQNMVILSNSVNLKIKAMSEGLLCEGAKEFRETLMNPCSDRFMWAASVPRGAAWSRLDEAALAENYYNSHRESRRNVPRPVEAARGLKLILLHNSSSLCARSGDQLRR
ncbi:FHA domain-containing protein PS1-like [Triticum dicoccoides]|uniref:FHA domain-containing protein PS1-like n=1 Tax=Triticum dicoccoides TaxID=85692 RepID=UPI00188FB78D|nr:FHA domain-containing protein PS1-like [Triticum dicoccoides]